MKAHKHEWNTKYTRRFYADGVEWYCLHCGVNLSWSEAKKRVNDAEPSPCPQCDGSGTLTLVDMYEIWHDIACPVCNPEGGTA